MLSTEKVEWWKAIVSSINDGILVIDHEGIVRLINPEYTRITGVREEEIIGKPLHQLRPGAKLPNTLKDGKCRVGVYRKEGNREYVVDMAPIILEGEIIGAVSVCKSLTEVHKLTHELKKKKQKIEQLQRTIDSLYQAKYTFDQIIGKEGGLKQTIQIAERAAETDLPILIMGESGTGKELLAQAIHNRSNRRERPFIPVNCAAIPPALLESELFGYEEGSFTHAKKGGKIGLFELASNGTIFLDEVGDMPFELQAKLLRVLQEQKIRRVGGMEEKDINIRVIAATNRNLEQLVFNNSFRQDLFYRLNVIRIEIPPLRERREDIPKLVETFLRSSLRNVLIGEEVMKFLLLYDWPGNVRELKNAIDYAVCMADGGEIQLCHLPKWISELEVEPKQTNRTLREVIEEAERKLIRETLNRFGNGIEEKKKAAQALGISLATLYNKIKKYHIDPNEDRF